MYSRGRSAIARLLLDGRNSTRTSAPRATSCRVKWLPRNPAAPVTSIFGPLLTSFPQTLQPSLRPLSQLGPPPLHSSRRAAHRTLPAAAKNSPSGCSAATRELLRVFLARPHGQ